ncbi:murein biosynthesis integral membrane protein MurJ [Akkermansiaceae bacterium]|nr:murein biosynthesis integral membrane protein MurJ [Akkermansiaceae bacterium]
MLRSLMQVSGFTAISRVLGFVRDILIARYLGSGLLGDAFFSAFRFPNLFRRIFGEGAFNAAFVPMFGRRLEKEGEEDAMKFASNAFSTLLVVLIALTLVAIPCMHWIMGAVVPGFKAKVEMPLAVSADTPERENFSMAISGSRAICLTIDGAGGTAQQQLAKLRLVKELPRKFSNILGDGPRGDSVSLQDYQYGLINASDGDVLKQVNPMKGITMGKGDYSLIQDGTRAWIYLPKQHDFGWFEGELMRTASVEGVGADHQFKIYRNHPDTFDLTVRLSQITFCYLLFMALVAHLSGVLNTFKIFGVPAAAPILLNIVFLAGLGIFVAWQHSEVPAHVLAWCVAIAGVLQFSMLYGTCWKNGYHVRLQKPVFDSSIKRLFLLMGPGILAAGIQQINLLVGGIIASFKQGAISWLYYSDRVYQLPLGMIGIALGVVLLPEVTRLVRRDDAKGASDSMVRGMELGLLITLPAAVAMMVIPEPIITVLFQRGEFTADDAYQTGMALRGFALGLPGYVLIKVLQPGFFARENTRAPMIMAGITVLVNIVVSLLLFAPLGHVGIAIATTIAAWVNVLLLARGLKGLVHVDKAFWTKSLRICMASVAMGALVWGGYQLLGSWFEGAFWKQCTALTLLIGLGMSVYAVLVLALRATSIAELKAGFRRG